MGPKPAITSDESYNSSDFEEGQDEVPITSVPDDFPNRIMSTSHSDTNIDNDINGNR